MASHEIVTRSKTGSLPDRNYATMPFSTSHVSVMQPISSAYVQTTAMTTPVVTTRVSSSSPVSEQMQNVSPSFQGSPASSTFAKQYADRSRGAVFRRGEQQQPEHAPFATSTRELLLPEPSGVYHYTGNYPRVAYGDMPRPLDKRGRPPLDPYQGTAAREYSMEHRPAAGSVQVPWMFSQHPPPPVAAERSTSSTSRVSHSVRLRLPSFSGKGKWETFIRQFEALAANGRWSEDEKLGHLWAALSDDAADYAFELEPEILESYVALVTQLERRFKVKHTRETHQRLFYSRVMKSGENYRQFAADLKSLVHKAYPTGITNEVREDMLLKQFFDGLCDAEEARYYVKYLQRPRSIDEAVDLMQEYQGYRGKSKVTKRHPVCMVRPADDDSDDEISTAESENVRVLFPSKKQEESNIDSLCANVRDLTKAVNKLLEQQTSKFSKGNSQEVAKVQGKRQDKSTIRCFNCQGFGHISRECPSPKEKPQQDKRNPQSKQATAVKTAEKGPSQSDSEN